MKTAFIWMRVQLDPRYPWKAGQPPLLTMLEERVCDAMRGVEGVEIPTPKTLRVQVEIRED